MTRQLSTATSLCFTRRKSFKEFVTIVLVTGHAFGQDIDLQVVWSHGPDHFGFCWEELAKCQYLGLCHCLFVVKFMATVQIP